MRTVEDLMFGEERRDLEEKNVSIVEDFITEGLTGRQKLGKLSKDERQLKRYAIRQGDTSQFASNEADYFLSIFRRKPDQ